MGSDLATQRGGGAPTSIRPPDLRQFDRFAAAGDRLIALHLRLRQARIGGRADWTSAGEIAGLEALIAEATGPETTAMVDQLRRDRAAFDPRTAYARDGALRVETVAASVAILLAAFPSGHADPGTFARILVAEVHAMEPTAIELETAMRELRRAPERRFVPAIGEALAAIERARATWLRRFAAADAIEGAVADLRQVLDQRRVMWAAQQAEQARESERRKPVQPGDRVKHVQWGGMDYGVGTAAEPGPEVSTSEAAVDFDDFGFVVVRRRELRRLLPDERGYVPAPNVAEAAQSAASAEAAPP
ncbi:hypothetical protein CCR97_18955 [Rhodoplanes elegans]|uniref:Uncharacterized protein n=1 Tax=Rhodoplanes elegans TaxID=29408 RepID=A0A327KTQ8_9BRAD|nr:hypothetical protein [Rhodoplanes elegans]MBK5960264.1 hypothetical protein [Rhodoplanes elegans]RAI40712.1 hypothetical protein CH338_05340 [Rhodoplanes elegans]